MRWNEVLSEDQSQTAVFAFGRFNPPTQGHEKVVDKLMTTAKANNADAFIFTSKSHDNKRNPLDFVTKVQFLRSFFKKATIVDDNYISNNGSSMEVNSAFDPIYYLASKGYKNIIMVAGSDRVSKYEMMVDKYMPINNPDVDPEKAANIDSFEVVSAGERDPDAEGVSGASATKAREYAVDGDAESFVDLVAPKTGTKKLKNELFKAVQQGMKGNGK